MENGKLMQCLYVVFGKCRARILRKRHVGVSLLISVFFLTIGRAGHAEAIEEFLSIPSSTPKVDIKVSIVRPALESRELPVVIFVGGTYSSADGELYAHAFPGARTGKFWYRDVAFRLADRGYRVVRFDNRGLGSVLRCEKQLGRQVQLDEYFFNTDCLDLNAAGTTSSDTRVQDLMTVIDMARTKWSTDSFILLTHSEGVVPTSKLIEMGKINPLALVFISGFASSSRDLMHWQFVDREIEWLQDIANQHNGVIRNADIDKLPATKTVHYEPMKMLKWESETFGVQNLDAIRARLEERYQNDLKKLLAAPSDAKQYVTVSGGALVRIPVSSLGYITDLLSDKTSILDRIKDYPGSVTYVLGTEDVLVNTAAQARQIASAKHPVRMSAMMINGMDHWLSNPDHSLNEPGMTAVIQAVESAGTGAPVRSWERRKYVTSQQYQVAAEHESAK